MPNSIRYLLVAIAVLSSPSLVIGQTALETPQAIVQRLMDAASDAPVPVIVSLRLPYQPEHLLPSAAVAAQRLAIAATQDRVAMRLAQASDRSIKRYPLLPAIALTVTRAELAQLAADPDVENIQQDGMYYPTLTESVDIIGAVEAGVSGFTGAGQTVAVIDSGVDKTHTLLAGKVVSEACYSTTTATTFSTCPASVEASTAPESGLPCTGASGCFHGTHVAGIAAGNGAGLRGAASGASVIAIQVFSLTTAGDIGAFLSDVDLALQRVYELRTSFNIASVNMSIGGGQFSGNCDAQLPTTKSAIDLLRGAGIATVISSGNSGWTDTIGAPACISTAIAVGSTDKSDRISEFSNVGPQVHLLAPGTLIYSSVPGDAFGYASGTSMAAPHVAGSWAIMKQRKPGATVTEILDAFQNTGVLVVDSRSPYNGALGAPAAGFARKRIDVRQALTLLVGGPEEVVLVDFDGDARDDVLLYDRSTGVWSIRRTTAAGTLELYRQGSWAPGWNIRKADFDNDGLDDLFLHNLTTGGWFKVLNNGAAPFTYVEGGWIPGLVPYVSELNDDGRTDIFLYSPTTGLWFKAVTADTGRAGFTYVTGGWRAEWIVQTADFNGDGLTDFFLFDESSGVWFKAIGDGAAGFTYFSEGWLTGHQRVIADLNGDGRSDVLLINPVTGTWFKCVSSGDGTRGFVYESGGWIPGFSAYVANFDGNAAMDLFLYNVTNGVWYKVINNGTTMSYVGGGWAIWRPAVGDMTADGRSDFLLFSPSSSTWYLAASAGITGFTYTSGEW